MMSSGALKIADCLISGAFTLHDLLATMLQVEKIPPDQVDEYLHSGLGELARSGWISWEFESDYGNSPSERPAAYDFKHFERDWSRCVAHGPLRAGIVPDKNNPTILFEAAESLYKELRKKEYDDVM